MNLKNNLSSRRRTRLGFTLVELLVVIGIIAILASVLLAAGNAAIKAAMRAKAQNYANQLQTAATAYYTEYNVYPAPYQSSPTPADTLIADTDTVTWPVLVPVLCGNINPFDGTSFVTSGKTITNSRNIPFLALKSSDVDKNNCPLNPLPTTATPVANYFNMALDTDYDGALGTTASAINGKMPNFAKSTTTTLNMTGTSTIGVAVWANCNGSATSKNPAFWIKTY